MMKNNNVYDGLNNLPVNKVALRVLSNGTSFEFSGIESGREESKTPFPITWGKMPNNSGFINLTGFKRGRLTVIGWNDKKGRWVCRCLCGTYVYRTSKAIKNEKNKIDACYQCTKLIDTKKKYHFLKTGRQLNREDFL
jgi:hypothetical protein